jgi:hypothetical protein
MSKKTIKALRTIIGVRERHNTRLEESLVAAKVQLRELQVEVDQALSFLGQCQNNERSARDQRDDLINHTFNPDKLIAFNFRVDALSGITADAAKTLEQRKAAVQSQEEVIANIQREIRRNLRRIDTFKDRIKTILREQEQLIEEAAEEETEETSTARFCARQRAAKVVEYV